MEIDGSLSPAREKLHLSSNTGMHSLIVLIGEKLNSHIGGRDRRLITNRHKF